MSQAQRVQRSNNLNRDHRHASEMSLSQGTMYKYQKATHQSSMDDRQADEETGGGSAYDDEHAEQTAELGAQSDRLQHVHRMRHSDQQDYDEEMDQQDYPSGQDADVNSYHQNQHQQQLPSFANLQSVPEQNDYGDEDGDYKHMADYVPNREPIRMSAANSLAQTQSQSMYGSKPQSRRVGDGLLHQPSNEKPRNMKMVNRALTNQSDDEDTSVSKFARQPHGTEEAHDTRISSMSPTRLAAQAAQMSSYVPLRKDRSGKKVHQTRDDDMAELEKASRFVLTNQRPRNGASTQIQTKTSETTNKYVDTVKSPNSNAGMEMHFIGDQMESAEHLEGTHAHPLGVVNTSSTLAGCQMATSDAKLAFESTNACAGQTHVASNDAGQNAVDILLSGQHASQNVDFAYGINAMQDNTDMDELREYEAQMEQIQKLQQKLDSSHHLHLNENSSMEHCSQSNLNESMLRPEIMIEQNQTHNQVDQSQSQSQQLNDTTYSRQRVLRNLSAEYRDLQKHNQKLDRLINQSNKRPTSIDSKKFTSQQIFGQSQMEPRSSGMKAGDAIVDGEVTGDFRSRVTIQRSDHKSQSSQLDYLKDGQNLKTLQANTNKSKSRGNSANSNASRHSSMRPKSQKSRRSSIKAGNRSKVSRSHATGTIDQEAGGYIGGSYQLNIQVSPSQQSYHKQIQLKSGTNADAISQMHGIPSSIHSSNADHNDDVNIQEVQMDRNQGFFSEPTQAAASQSEMNIHMPTEFARQMQKLYDQLIMVYPSFGVDTAEANDSNNGRIVVPSEMNHDSTVYAIQLYNQLSFLYQRAKEHKIDNMSYKKSELQQMESRRSTEQHNGDLQHRNHRLSQEIESLQNKLNVEVESLQEQLKISELRERDAQLKAQRQFEIQNQTIQAAERRFQDIKQVVERLEREKIDLTQRNNALSAESRNLRDKDGAGNISFRGNSQDLKRQPSASVQSTHQHKLLNELEDARSELNKAQINIRELQAKLKAQEEFHGVEKQHSAQVKAELNNVRQQQMRDEESFKTEIARLEDLIDQKSETIKLLNNQLEEFANTVAFEFPLMMNVTQTSRYDGPNETTSPSRRVSRSPTNNEVQLMNQRANATKPKLISMMDGHQSKQQDMNDIYLPFGFLSDEQDEGDDGKNMNMPLRGKSGQAQRKSASAMQKKKKLFMSKQQGNNMVNTAQLVQSQIASAALAEKVAKKLRDEKVKQIESYDTKLAQLDRVQQDLDSFEKTKNEFAVKQKQLSRENEELKVKFSQLLDQFQEYVNETERKVEEEQMMQKEMQEKLLSDLNQTIRELEEMSKNLQKEGEDKDVKIAEQHGELSRLQQALNASTEYSQNEQNQQRMNSLTEEIECLKKHYLREMEALRAENAKLRSQAERNRSPQRNGAAQRAGAREANYPGIDDQYGMTHGRVRLSPHLTDIANGRSKSQDRAGAMHGGSIASGMTLPEDRAIRQAVIDTQVRSRSGNSRENVAYAPQQMFNQTSGSLRGILVNSAGKNRGESFENGRTPHHAGYAPTGHCERSTMVSPTRAGYFAAQQSSQITESMRRELAEKNTLIEQKNRDLVQMRLELDELRSNFVQNDALMITQQQRNQVLTDFDSVVKKLRLELERVKVNLSNGAGADNGRTAHNDNSSQPLNYHIIPCEKKLLNLIQEKVHGMHELSSLTSDILLLASKQKYMQASSANRSSMATEWRMIGDERAVSRYENTLQQLDAILKADRDHVSSDAMYDLKKLTENQMHEMVRLQQEVDMLKHGQGKSTSDNSLINENAVLKQEISMLREQAARSEYNGQRARSLERHGADRKEASDFDHQDLLQRARNAEDKLHDREKVLSEVRAQIKEKEKQLEEVRSRVTVVAELFEKKPIKQRYSFEVLCDFVHDKAKRLFNKYENAVRDKKATKDEQLQYYHRKISQLDQEVDKHKEYGNLLRKQVVPRICALLKKPVPTGERDKSKDKARQHSPSVSAPESDHISVYFVRQVLDDLEYTWRHNNQELSQTAQQSASQKNKIRELQALVERLSIQDGTMTQGLSRVTSAYNGNQGALLSTPQTNNNNFGSTGLNEYATGPAAMNTFGGQSAYSGNGTRTTPTNSQNMPALSEGRIAGKDSREVNQAPLSPHAISMQQTDQSQVYMQVIDQQAAVELENMRDEKQKMNDKLDEFAKMLREFQLNQKAQLDENSRLKEKIESLQKVGHMHHLQQLSSDPSLKQQHASFADENMINQQMPQAAYRDPASAGSTKANGGLSVLNPMTVSDGSALAQSNSGTNSNHPVASNRFVVARSYHVNQNTVGENDRQAAQINAGFFNQMDANSQQQYGGPGSSQYSAAHAAAGFQSSVPTSHHKRHGYSPGADQIQTGKDDTAAKLASSQKMLPLAQSALSTTGAQGNTQMHSLQHQ